jgi:hypothetical protein
LTFITFNPTRPYASERTTLGMWGRSAIAELPTRGRAWNSIKDKAEKAVDWVDDHDDHSFDVVERGGNVAVHVSAPPSADAEVDRLKETIEGLGGWSDGKGWTRDRSTLTVFTIPFGAGFAAIESTLNAYLNRVPSGEWYYVNVYDPADDTTPLNWWLS